MINDANISLASFNNYLSSYTSIVVSGNYVYTISIRNPLFFNAMKGIGFNNKKENKFYGVNFNKYISANNLDISNSDHIREAGEYSLLKQFGDQITISKHEIGKESNVQLLSLDSNNKVQKSNPC